jgi:DNA gyrase subunit A
MVNRFLIDEVRRVGRSAMGVSGMKFKIPGDRVCGFAVCEPEATLLCVTENGRGKRSAFEDFRMTHRGSMGVVGNPSHNERNGDLIGVAAVKGDETMILLAKDGMTVRIPVDQVRVMGRTAAGVNFMNLADGETLASFSLAPKTIDAPATEPTVEGVEAPAAEMATDAPVVEAPTAETEPSDEA